jgi:hypothetical protein
MERHNSHHMMASDAERYFPVQMRVARGRLGRNRQCVGGSMPASGRTAGGMPTSACQRIRTPYFSISSPLPMRRPLSTASRTACGSSANGHTVTMRGPTRATCVRLARCARPKRGRAWLTQITTIGAAPIAQRRKPPIMKPVDVVLLRVFVGEED